MSKPQSIPRWAGRSFNVGVHKVRILWARVLLGSAALALTGLAVNELTAPSPATVIYNHYYCELVGVPQPEILGKLQVAEAAPPVIRATPAIQSEQTSDPVSDDIIRLVERLEQLTLSCQAPSFDGGPEQIKRDVAACTEELERILEKQERLREQTRRLIEGEE